jgi:isoaspartyl peptidase/L-asparaginase-like protein (Ntn-hydrolase superfamily)
MLMTTILLQYFIRQATASTIARRMQYNNESVTSATKHAVEDLKRDGGEGGVIAVSRLGDGESEVYSGMFNDKLTFVDSRHAS